ncbi:MAG TPA: twin-arginine translocase subunit TatC [Saprospiraceae bacterium]|nr:twin-arginine translocase subunit TatC [Saprospiraceae bacterium]
MAFGKRKKNANEMSFFEHIEELRWHIIRSAVAVLVVSVGIFLMKDFIFQDIILGPTSPDFVTYRVFCELLPSMCFYPGDLHIITRDIQEQFLSHVQVSVTLGIIVAFPFILYEFWKFIKPGLYKKEIRAAKGMVFICSFLFLTGVLFGFFIVAPIAITFLSTYSVSPDVANTTTLDALVNSMTMFTLPTGLVFELPVIMYFLAKIGLISYDFLKKYRRHAIVVIAVIAAVVTPPDAITMMMIGIPLYVLFEVSVIVVKRIDKEKKRKEEQEEQEEAEARAREARERAMRAASTTPVVEDAKPDPPEAS